jgi:glutathione peroxidase
MYENKNGEGFSVLAFPCNQFGAQEPGSDAEIVEFAQSKYDVKFPMFSKVEVNGEGACDLYKFLKSSAPDGEGKEDIAWNFTKFLIGKDGGVLKRYDPMATPADIEKDLAEFL